MTAHKTFSQTNDEFQLMNSPLEFRVLEVQRAYGTDAAKGSRDSFLSAVQGMGSYHGTQLCV